MTEQEQPGRTDDNEEESLRQQWLTALRLLAFVAAACLGAALLGLGLGYALSRSGGLLDRVLSMAMGGR